MAVTLDTNDLLQRSQTVVNQAVDRGTSLLADRVEHYINIARQVGDVLRERNEPQAADLVQAAAERANSVASYLRNNDGMRIWSDAQDFARDKTWLLAGAGFLGGLAAARTIRSAADMNGSRRTYTETYAQPTSSVYSQSGNYST